jgi:DNA-binding NarL/FixJ family response regulator
VKLFVLDPDTAYRRGLVASLALMPGVERVDHAGSVDEARESGALHDADVVIVDPAVPGGGELAFSVDARVMVCSSEMLGNLLRGLSPEPARSVAGPLTDREQQVLALIAAGHPTREVAQQLSYSERTVKNVLHDVVTKLNARSRSQAVAFAVREGLI